VIVLTSPVVNTEGTDLSRSLWQIAASIILAALSRYLVEDPIRRGHQKQLRMKASDIRWWRKPLAFSAKISVSVLLVIVILLVTANTGTQSSAKEPEHRQVEEKQVQEVNKESGTEAMRSDIKGNEITAIGDSLMLDVEPVLQTSLPGIVIDGKLGRQMYQAPAVIEELKGEGKLGRTVIIELGTNGSFTEGQLEKTLETLEGTKNIILVNTRVPRPWETVVNEALAAVPEDYPNVMLIDWYSASSGCNDYFYPDGVHLNQKGAKAYGEIIIKALAANHDDI